MRNNLLRIFLLLAVWPAMVTAGLPEFGFCPQGGPPGWINRMTGWDRNYSPPVYQPSYPYAFQSGYIAPYNFSSNYPNGLANQYAPAYSYPYGGFQYQ